MNEDLRTAPRTKQPIVNLPLAVTLLGVILLTVHVLVHVVINREQFPIIFVIFGYIPNRADFASTALNNIYAPYYTLLTHAFLHQNWVHVIFNTVWLAVFGTPVVRRYGAMRFLLLWSFGSIIGALVFLWGASDQFMILVGASGGVSALIGGAVRFIFQPSIVHIDPDTHVKTVLGRKLATFGDLWHSPRALSFIGFWLGINIVIGLVPTLFGDFGNIAWQAHLGGFFAGFFMVAWFEKRFI